MTFITLNFYPCVNCAVTTLERLTQDVYENCAPSIDTNILINKGECNKAHNTETKKAKRNMRHAEKKYMEDKTNELKHNEFRRLGQLKCDWVTLTEALYYKNKLNECGNDASKNLVSRTFC